MGKITSISELETAITILKADRELKGQIFRQEFCFVSESLQPINVLKSAFRDGTSSLNLYDGILGAIAGVAVGALTRKVLVGSSANLFRKLLGSVVQFAATRIVSRNTKSIKLVGSYILQRLIQKKGLSSNAI
jgi:hypothetical protein